MPERSPFGDEPVVSPFGDSPVSPFGDPAIGSSAFAEQSVRLEDLARFTGPRYDPRPKPQPLTGGSTEPGTFNPQYPVFGADQPLNPSTLPRRRSQPTPAEEERSLLGETIAAFERTAVDIPESVAKTAVGLFAPEEAASLDRVLPYGPQPSRDDFLGKAANITGDLAAIALLAGPGKFGGVRAGGIGFGPRSYERVLERTEGNGTAALGAGALSAGLGVIPFSQYVRRVPGLQSALTEVGLSKAQKALSNYVIETLASGTANLGIGAGEEAIARLGGATPEDPHLLEQFVVGAAAHGVFSARGTVREVRQFQNVQNKLLESKLFSKEELTLIGDRPEVLKNLTIARAEGYLVEIKPVLKDGKVVRQDDGNVKLQVKAVKDVVTQREKALLGHNEPAIDAYRDYRKNGGEPLSEFDNQAPWLAFRGADREGYFRPAEELSDNVATQRRLAKLQRKATEQLLQLRSGAQGLTLEQKARLTERLDAEFTDKVAQALGEDTNSPVGARRRITRETQNNPKLKTADQASSLDALNKMIDYVSERYPLESQLGTIERLIQEVDSGRFALSNEAREYLVNLRDRTLNVDTARPLSERVARAQVGLREAVQNLAGVEFAQARDTVAKLAQDLPDKVKAELYKQAIDARTLEELRTVAENVGVEQEKYLRATNASRVRKLVEFGQKGPGRDRVLERLGVLDGVKGEQTKPVGEQVPETPAAKPAEPTPKPPESITGVTFQFRGKEYVGQATHDQIVQEILEEAVGKVKALQLLVRDDAALQAIADTPGEQAAGAKLALELRNTPDSARGFKTSEGRTVDRAEGGRIAKVAGEALSTDLVKGKDAAVEVTQEEVKPETVEASKGKTKKPQRPLLTTSKKTGYVQVDQAALKQRLTKLTTDELKVLRGDLETLVRQAQIERGLYRNVLGFETKADVKAAKGELARNKTLGRLRQGVDTGVFVLKQVFDPATMDARLEQLARGDKRSTLYSVLHGLLTKPYDRHLFNRAERDRTFDTIAHETLGIDSEGPVGKYKLGRYLNEVLPSGTTRGRAMTLYALKTDPGRAADLAEFGAVDAVTDLKVSLSSVDELSAQDRAYVDRVKEYLEKPEYINKAYRNVLLLTGKLPERVRGWFPSRRKVERTKLDPTFTTFSESLERTIDPLKDRQENATSPFEINDFYSTAVSVTDQLSLFGELGRELYRADSLVQSQSFKEQFIEKQGKAAYDELKLYLANVHGSVGPSSTAIDEIVSRVQTGFTVSRVALNVFSAAKQYLHVLTMLADGTLATKDIVGSLVDGSAVSRKTRTEMLANSGLAYQRFVGGHYLQNFLVLGNQGKPPTKLGLVQHYSMALQRAADRHVMQVTWEAARRTAKREGLKGAELVERTNELFSVSAGRDQPTDNPLYASHLEIKAKQQPLYRAALMFQREQNRIYNVARRHVVRSIQEPTTANVSRAGRAVLLTAVGQSLAVSAVNELRRLAFARPSDDKDLVLDAVTNITGLYYLAGPVEVLASGLIDLKRQQTDRLYGPLAQVAKDTIQAIWDGTNAFRSEDDDIKVGVYRGRSRTQVGLIKAADAALSSVSGGLGLPLWSVWTQGKGLYKWADDQVRLMTYFEHEWAQLRDRGEEKGTRGRVMQRAREDINKVHRMREAGLLGDDTARSRIESVLRRVVD